MANAHANKVVINGVTKIDLTGDTVDAEHLMQGYTAHDKAGALIVGTATGGGGKGGDYNIIQTVDGDMCSLNITDADVFRLQSKSTTANGTISPDTGYDGLSAVTVNVPTGAPRSASDITVSGATVNVPAGLYSSAASKSVASGSAKTPTTTITAAPSISVDANGLVTASNSKTQSVTPSVTAGYVAGGTAGTITVNGSNTYQLSVYDGSVS